MLDSAWCRDEAVQSRNREDEADVRGAARSGKRKRPLAGRVAAKPTVELHAQPVGDTPHCSRIEHIDSNHNTLRFARDQSLPKNLFKDTGTVRASWHVGARHLITTMLETP